MKTLKGLYLILLLVVTCAEAQNKIDFDSFINNIRKNHPLVKRAQGIATIGDEMLRGARGNYDPNLTGSISNKFYDGSNYYSMLNSEIKQAIFTNQSIRAGYELGEGSYLNPQFNTPQSGLLYVGIEAALLQGLVIDKRRADVLKAEQYKAMNKSEQLQLTNYILFQSSIYYSDWLFTQKLLNVTRYFTDLSIVRLNAISQLTKIGERADIDTTEASMLVQQRILDYQSALVDNQKQIAAIAINNWQNEKAEEFNVDILSSDSLTGLVNKLKLKFNAQLLDRGHSNPIIAQYESKIKLLDVERRYRAELVKPVLNVNYNFLSNNTSQGLDAQFSQNNYRWGATLAFPLFLRNSRAELSIAKLNVKNSNYELEMKRVELDTKIALLINSIRIIDEQVQIAERTVDFSKRMVEAEKLKFENGESSVFLINTRETKWLESEIKLNEYRLKYVKAVLELIYVKGSLAYTD